jgi:hypothetical protein
MLILHSIMYLVINLCEQPNFELTLVSDLKSYFEQQRQLKDIKEEVKNFYGGAEAGKLGQAVRIVHNQYYYVFTKFN